MDEQYIYTAFPPRELMERAIARKQLEDAMKAARERVLLGEGEGQGIPEYLGGHAMKAFVKPSAWRAMKEGREPVVNPYFSKIKGAIRDYLDMLDLED